MMRAKHRKISTYLSRPQSLVSPLLPQISPETLLQNIPICILKYKAIASLDITEIYKWHPVNYDWSAKMFALLS